MPQELCSLQADHCHCRDIRIHCPPAPAASWPLTLLVNTLLVLQSSREAFGRHALRRAATRQHAWREAARQAADPGNEHGPVRDQHAGEEGEAGQPDVRARRHEERNRLRGAHARLATPHLPRPPPRHSRAAAPARRAARLKLRARRGARLRSCRPWQNGPRGQTSQRSPVCVEHHSQTRHGPQRPAAPAIRGRRRRRRQSRCRSRTCPGAAAARCS